MTSPSWMPQRAPRPFGRPPAQPPLPRTRGSQGEHGLAALESIRRGDGDRGQARPLHFQERQPQLEVLGDDLRPLGPPFGEADLYRFPSHDDVVDGEDEPGRINDGSRAHTLITQDARGRMRGGHLGVNVYHRGEALLDELDRGIHESVVHASTLPYRRATARARNLARGRGLEGARQEVLEAA